MRLYRNIIIAMLALLTLLGCSREGFKESLNRSSSSQTSSSGESAESIEDNTAVVFDLDAKEETVDGAYLYYALPIAVNEKMEDAATQISDKITSAIFSLKDEISKGKTVYNLNVFDAVTQNDNKYFSTMYEIEYLSDKDVEEEKYCFGLAFDSTTGELLGIESVMDPDVLVALIMDEQASKISEKEVELTAKKRNYLNDQGSEKLKQRLTYPDGVVSLEGLLDASFYLDGSKLVVVFAAPQDIGGVVEVSVPL